MNSNKRDIILRFSQQVKSILGDKLDKVILYGSYARGDCINALVKQNVKGNYLQLETKKILEHVSENSQ